MRISKSLIAIISIALLAVLSSAAFAVIDPASGTATPNGNFIFVPNQWGTDAIRVVNADTSAEVQKISVVGGSPASMVTSPDGKTLFVVVTSAGGSRVRSYTINQTTGNLTSLSYVILSPSSYVAGRQCAITPDGKYLYVADYDNSFADVGMRVYVIDVSDPSSMTAVLSSQIGTYLWGVAMKPDGTRLYVGSRDSAGYKIYVLNIVGANRTNPQVVTTIDLGTTKDPTYLAVNSDGDKLFVRVQELSDPGDNARKDVLVYDISGSSPVLNAEVFKIKGNTPAFRTTLPGDHLPADTDYDNRNASEGMALSPNGWFMYFSHYNGPSANGGDYWRDTLYGTSVASLENGFDRTNSGEIWVCWGGLTQESPAMWGGWHSSDGLIATRKHKVFYTYSDDSITPEFLSVSTTNDANIPPIAPKITHPTQESGVTGYITWEPSEDDGLICPLTYTVEYILASTLELGTSSWQHMAYSATGETYAPLAGVLAGTAYYARVQAFDGKYTSPWSYTGPFTMDANFAGPPTWESYYLVTSHEAVVDWSDAPGADHYVIEYKKVSDTNWSSTEILSTDKYNPDDPNPNCQLTGLTQLATYEFRVIAKKGGTESFPSSPGTFYTLERPWADFYNPDLTEVYITWGPEVSSTEIAVPLSDHYNMQYRRNGGAWTDSGKTLDNSDIINAKLTILFDGLTANSTYEVKIRTVDGTGGASDWSDIKTFHTIRGPRWVNVSVTGTHEVTMLWENVSAPQYELAYSKAPSAEGQFDQILTGTTEYHTTTIDAYTTYYTKVRALTLNGPSDWSPVKSFFTMPGPTWIDNYNTTTTTTYLTWESVSGITSYEVNYGVSTEPMSWTSCQDHITGLLGRTWYVARIRAHNGLYASDWIYDDFFTIPAPNNVEWMGSTATTADISWEPVYLDSAIPPTLCTSYEVSWGITFDAQGSGEVMTSNPFITLTGLITNRNYYIKVRARDDTNNGYSNWAPYNPVSGLTMLKVPVTTEATITNASAFNGVTSGWRGTTVTIIGSNFGSTMGTVKFNGKTAQPAYWKNRNIVVSVPPTAESGWNTITITTATGESATSPDQFNVLNGGFVLDDIEGGVYEYATWEIGSSGSVKEAPNYDPPLQEGIAYLTVECTGNATYEIVGGVSTYGDLPTEDGYDISSYKKIKFWIRNDSPSTPLVVFFELVEANTAPGNRQDNSLASEVWKYNVPITVEAMSSWEEITINLSTTDATGKFEWDDSWWPDERGPSYKELALNKIKAYQILTAGNNPKFYAIDYICATEEGGGTVSNIYITREGDVPTSNIRLTWEATSNVDIWTKTLTFETNPASWTKEFSNVSGTSQVDSSVAGKVGSGTNKWYKIMPAGVALTTADLTQEVVGKFDYNLNVGYNMISLPFQPFNTTVQAEIGGQLTGGLNPGSSDQVQTLIDGVWQTAWYHTSGSWIGNVTIEADPGYWIYITGAHPSKIISMVGKTVNNNRTIKLSSLNGKFNLIGTAFPIPVSTNSLGLTAAVGFTEGTPATGDQMTFYNGSSFDIAFLSSASHQWQSATLTQLVPGKAYYVYKQNNGDYMWTYTKPY